MLVFFVFEKESGRQALPLLQILWNLALGQVASVKFFLDVFALASLDKLLLAMVFSKQLCCGYIVPTDENDFWDMATVVPQ